MKLFALLKKDLLILLRDRAEMAVLFLMPLAFILPISFALGKGDGYGINRDNEMITIPVINYDGGPRAQELMSAVGESLRLEVEFDTPRIRSLGLADDPDCEAGVIYFTETPQVTPTATVTAFLTPTPGTPTVAVTETQTEQPTETPAAQGTESDTIIDPGATTQTATVTPTVTVQPVATDYVAPNAFRQELETGFIALTGAKKRLQNPEPTAAATEGTPAATAQETVTETDPTEGDETAEAIPSITPTGQDLVSSISPVCGEKIAQAMLQRSQRTAALIIPPGFSENLDAGERSAVTLLYDPTGDSVVFQQIEGIVKGATIKISLRNQVASGMLQMVNLAAFAPESVRAEVEKQASEPIAEDLPPALSLVEVEPNDVTVEQTPDTYQQTIPGYTVMYVFFIIAALAGSIRQERQLGTFRRMLSMPVNRFELLGSKLLAAIIIGMMQVGVLFFIGSVLFNLRLGRDLPALFFLSLALVSAATAIGLAAATTSIRGSSLAAPLVISALLGGCMFPIDLMPPVMRAISYLVPHSWALNGYQDLMVRGLGMNAVLPNIGVLAAFALVFFLIAIYRFEFVE